jgi:hypothetical protein
MPLRCVMDRYKEQFETVPLAAEVRPKRCAPAGSALSDDVLNHLRRIARALARSAAVAEHKDTEDERKDQT